MESVDRGEQFVAVLEKAYAPYKSPVARREVVHWANGKDVAAVRATYQELRETFSNRYGSPPDLPDVIVAYKAVKETLPPPMALPDPEYEERKRTITPEERALSAEFLKKVMEGMSDGVHPRDVYAEWLAENPETEDAGAEVPDGGGSSHGDWDDIDEEFA